MNGSGLTIDQKQVFAVDLDKIGVWMGVHRIGAWLALVWHLIGQDWLRLDTNWNDLRIRVFWGLESWPWIHPPRRPGTIPYRALVPRLSRQMVLVNGMGLAWLLPMQGQSNSSCNLGCRSAWPERHAVWCISKGLVNCFQIGRLATHWHIGTGLDRIGQDWQIGELVLQWKIDL